MGASLAVQSLLKGSDLGSGGWFNWAIEEELGTLRNSYEKVYVKFLDDLRLWTPNPPYAPQPKEIGDIDVHEERMLSGWVIQITAVFNGLVVRDLSEFGLIREKTVEDIKRCMLAQRAFITVITTAMQKLAPDCPWGTVALSRLAEDRHHQVVGPDLLFPTTANTM